MWLSSDSSSFVNCRAHCPTRVRVSPSAPFRIRGEIIIILRFERRVCRWESCRMHQFTGMWLNPNSRGSRLRIWQPWGCKSLRAHHFTATGFSGNSRPRRLKIAEPSGCESRVADPACGSSGIADRFDSRSNSLGSASLPTPTILECQLAK